MWDLSSVGWTACFNFQLNQTSESKQKLMSLNCTGNSFTAKGVSSFVVCSFRYTNLTRHITFYLGIQWCWNFKYVVYPIEKGIIWKSTELISSYCKSKIINASLVVLHSKYDAIVFSVQINAFGHAHWECHVWTHHTIILLAFMINVPYIWDIATLVRKTPRSQINNKPFNMHTNHIQMRPNPGDLSNLCTWDQNNGSPRSNSFDLGIAESYHL